MKVKIRDWGEIYTTYDRWFKENNCEEYLDRYLEKSTSIDASRDYGGKWYPVDKNGNIIDTTNMTFEVVKEGVHNTSSEKHIYLIEEPITKKLFLISKIGTEEIK